jgi:hypothetical protein
MLGPIIAACGMVVYILQHGIDSDVMFYIVLGLVFIVITAGAGDRV